MALNLREVRAAECAGPRGCPPASFDRWVDYEYYMADQNNGRAEAAAKQAAEDAAAEAETRRRAEAVEAKNKADIARLIEEERARDAVREKAFLEKNAEYLAMRNAPGYLDAKKAEADAYNALHPVAQETDPALVAMFLGKAPDGMTYDTVNEAWRRHDSHATRPPQTLPQGTVFVQVTPDGEIYYGADGRPLGGPDALARGENAPLPTPSALPPWGHDETYLPPEHRAAGGTVTFDFGGGSGPSPVLLVAALVAVVFLVR